MCSRNNFSIGGASSLVLDLGMGLDTHRLAMYLYLQKNGKLSKKKLTFLFFPFSSESQPSKSSHPGGGNFVHINFSLHKEMNYQGEGKHNFFT